MPTAETEIETLANREYQWGFISDIEADSAPPGLNEEIVRFISHKKNEPQWMLDWRLRAYRHWLTMTEPHGRWFIIRRSIIRRRFTIPRPKPKKKSLDEVDPELLKIYEKLGVPVQRAGGACWAWSSRTVAVDAVFDSVSVTTTFKKTLAEKGIIFCSFGEAVQEHPELVRNTWGRWFRIRTIISRR
jgi:Fe-S cluster assembly protein SufB